MMTQAVKKMDELFQSALASGRLRIDATLILEETVIDEEELEEEVPTEAAESTDSPENAGSENGGDNPATNNGGENPTNPTTPTPPPAAVTTISVQIATPTQNLSGKGRARSARSWCSFGIDEQSCIGGTSAVRVVYQGDPAGLKAALQARGWRVSGSGSSLRISR